MSVMRFAILAVAAGAAVAAALVVRNMTQAAPASEVAAVAPAAPTIELTRVLTAKRDLALGERIVPEDLVWADWPATAVNPAFVTEATGPSAIMDLAGAVVRSNMVAGEPVTPPKLVLPGESGFMAAVLTPGKRAVSVEVSVETSVGGFVLPNDRVDVTLSRTVSVTSGANQVREAFTTDTILENVRVLAIDQTFREVEGDQYVVGSTATLELSPSDSEVLQLADRMGQIALVLRSVADISDDLPSGATTKGLALRLQGPDPNTLASGAGPTVRVVRAGQVTEQTIGGAS